MFESDQSCDGEGEPATLAGNRLAIHLRKCATGGVRMIEDAGPPSTTSQADLRERRQSFVAPAPLPID
jgi:hypothetical protein